MVSRTDIESLKCLLNIHNVHKTKDILLKENEN
jgi:hypothetical protein